MAKASSKKPIAKAKAAKAVKSKPTKKPAPPPVVKSKKPASPPAKITSKQKMPAVKAKALAAPVKAAKATAASVVAPVAKLTKTAPTPPVKAAAIVVAAASKSVKAAPPPPAKAVAVVNKPVKSKEREPERKGVIVPAPVPTDMKPAKNRIGLRSNELEHYRDMLLSKRRELLGDMSSMEHEALNRGGSSNLSNLPMHMADQGTDNYEQEFTLGLMEKDRNLLREINGALAKIQDGSYGICEGTGLAIGKPRLEAQPWAKYSIEHARKLEQRGVR